MTSLELLQGIELWLTVKREPSKKEVDKYLIEIREHIEEALAISCVGSAFYCQRDIEGDSICNSQCEHCNEYYKPLEQ